MILVCFGDADRVPVVIIYFEKRGTAISRLLCKRYLVRNLFAFCFIYSVLSFQCEETVIVFRRGIRIESTSLHTLIRFFSAEST